MRKKKALINSLFSLALEVVTIISGFILPRLLIGTFGSEANGLVSSITNFIGYITLLQSGVGSVAKAAMYRPLAKKDQNELCIVVRTVEHFFRKIALITVIYIGILSILFPTIIAPGAGSFVYTASLVLILGISTAAQYFFGITYGILLGADQRSYVYSIIQIVTIISNTVISVILIKAGCGIHMVKLGSSVVFVLRPMALNLYAKRKYEVNSNVPINNALIKQRWDGFAQAIAYFIHTRTDVFVLTLFARFNSNVSLRLISVYSVYALVTNGVRSFTWAVEGPVTSAFGNVIALEERENLKRLFNVYNTFMHVLCTALFATTSISVFNFISIYMRNVTDVNYIQRTFGLIIITAEYTFCIRLPYNSIIHAAGKFKETKRSSIIEAVINIVISVSLVGRFGLVGVAIGTLAAMLYRATAFMFYLSKNVIEFTVFSQVKRYLISFGIYFGLIAVFSKVPIRVNYYFDWIIYAGCVFIICGLSTIAVNFILANTDTKAVFKTLFRLRKKDMQETKP